MTGKRGTEGRKRWPPVDVREKKEEVNVEVKRANLDKGASWC